MDKKALIKYLSKLAVSNVKVYGNYISLVFDREKLRNRIVRKHIKHLGDWSRKKKEIYCDTHLKKEDVLPIIVHEVVEKYIVEKYGLNVDKDVHRIADAIEKNFIASREWRAHQQRIAEDHIHKRKTNKCK